MRRTFKVLFYVKKGSAKPNGKLPLMCRLTVDGEIKQFSCKIDVSPHLWDVKNNRASGKSAEAHGINHAVDKIRVEVNRRYQELMQTDWYVTAAKLKDAYLGIGIKQETLLKLFEQYNAEFAKKVGHSRAKGTFQRYITVCKNIREFLPHTYKREDIPLKELNLTFINDFEYFLRERLGFNDYIIRRLCTFKDVPIKGKLHSSEFNRDFETQHAVCSIKEDDNGKFDFKIG